MEVCDENLSAYHGKDWMRRTHEKQTLVHISPLLTHRWVACFLPQTLYVNGLTEQAQGVLGLVRFHGRQPLFSMFFQTSVSWL